MRRNRKRMTALWLSLTMAVNLFGGLSVSAAEFDEEDVIASEEAVDVSSSSESSIPDDAVYFETTGHYYCYYDPDEVECADDAIEYCEALGGHLATITSAEEDAFLYSYLTSLGYYNAYFGLTDRDSEGTWVWITGEEVTYTNWASGEGNNSHSNEDWGMYYYKYKTGKWNDGDFTETYANNGGTAFLCEWESGTEEEDDGGNGSVDDDSSGTSVIEGTFEYSSSFTQEDEEYTFTYDESWFSASSYEYQHDLVKMSIRVAMAAFAGSGGETDSSNITSLMETLGYENIVADYPETSTEDYSSTIGYAIAEKEIETSDGENYTLLMVAVRGGNYGYEWGSNLEVQNDLLPQYVLNDDVHYGFDIASEMVLAGIREYIETYCPEEDDLKVWISGYSRGAAVTNLVAAKLDDWEIEGIKAGNVYAFCFECPQNTQDDNASNPVYFNIVNIINPCDFVTKVAMNAGWWDFTRYGRDYYLPSANSTAGYDTYRVAMFAEYYSILYYAAGTGAEELYEGLSERVDEATDFTAGEAVVFDQMAKEIAWITVSPFYYYNNYQAGLAETAAEGTNDGNQFKIIADVLIVLVKLAASDLTDVAWTLGTVIAGGKYLSNLRYAHYPELCLAWLDSLEGSLTINGYRKLYINCPVDVIVYDNSGSLAAQITGGEVQDIEDGIYAYIDGDDQMVVVMPQDEEYSVILTATDDGEVTYTVEEYTWDDGTGRVVSYYKVAIQEGDTLYGTIEDLTTTAAPEYPLTVGGESLTADVDVTGDDAVSCTVTVEYEEGGSAYGGGYYVSGEFSKVTAQADDGYEFNGWYVDGELVSGEAEYRFLVEKDVTVTAVFRAADSNDDTGDDGGDSDGTDNNADADDDDSTDNNADTYDDGSADDDADAYDEGSMDDDADTYDDGSMDDDADTYDDGSVDDNADTYDDGSKDNNNDSDDNENSGDDSETGSGTENDAAADGTKTVDDTDGDIQADAAGTAIRENDADDDINAGDDVASNSTEGDAAASEGQASSADSSLSGSTSSSDDTSSADTSSEGAASSSSETETVSEGESTVIEESLESDGAAENGAAGDDSSGTADENEQAVLGEARSTETLAATGDGSDVLFWILLLFAAAAALSAAVIVPDLFRRR